MRFSDFKGEEAVDVLADIMLPASDIITDEEFKKMCRTAGIPYIKLAGYILKEHKSAVLDMYEPLMREPKAEATPVKLVQLIMDIVQDPDLSNLFFSQGQSEALKSSGSAMESTEDGEI